MDCRPRIFRALLLSVILPAAAVPAQDVADGAAPLRAPVDSRAWQAHFVQRVEQGAVRELVRAARQGLQAFSEDRTLPILDELEDQRLAALRELPRLPDHAVPAMLARNVEGSSLEAARAYASGEHQRALEILRAPELAEDAGAVHLRAQLLDELSKGLHAIYRLAVIQGYRRAIRLDDSVAEADRARLRIGQIYIELGMLPEARAALRPYLGTPMSGNHGTALTMTLAEAAFLDRDPTRALELLARLELGALPPAALRWELRRRGDALFNLERFAEAHAVYRDLLDDGRRIPDEALLGVRFAYTLVLHGRALDAIDVLETVLELNPAPQVAATARLVLARALRTRARHGPAVLAAAPAPALWPGSQIAALAAVEAIENARLEGRDSLALPRGAGPLVRPTTEVPALALLSYLVARRPAPGDARHALQRRLGALLVALPPGPLRQLVQDDLIDRVADDLEAHALAEPGADPGVLDTVARYLRPELTRENALLLAVEAMARDGRRSACVRWSRTMQLRETRPLRRGLAVWRRASCLGLPERDLATARALVAEADGGETGSFALALASLAAEIHVRRGELQLAADTYTRATTALGEPRLLGPVLLRLGEIEAAAGRPGLARRNLLRGLSMTEDPELASDPARKAGLLALVRLEGSESERRAVATLLGREGEHADDWWAPAWAYLAAREAGAVRALEGDAAFARAAREQHAARRVAGRVRRLLGEDSP